MKYQKTSSPKPVADIITKSIKLALSKNQRVLWLISGGSSLDVAVIAAQELTKQPQLTIVQVDERFGPPGHKDSNWQQFIHKGFNAKKFMAIPILTGKNIDQTTQDYATLLSKALNEADCKIGLFGIGVDGHTAGILPHSPAAREQSKPVIHYRAADFNRITISPVVFGRLDLAVAYATGPEKKATLNKLKSDFPLADQPAQMLKKAKELYVYTDL